MDTILHDIRKQRQAEAYLLTGLILLGLGESFRAEEALHEGLTLYSNEPMLWEAMGDTHVVKARDTKLSPSSTRGPEKGSPTLHPASECYEKTLKLNPANTAAVMKYFDVVTALGRMNEAVRVLRTHLHRSELEDCLRTRLGRIYLDSGDAASARQEFQRAVASNPANAEAKSLLAEAETRLIPTKKAG
jgi:tetratricopeptide (TPR) repeat protein